MINKPHLLGLVSNEPYDLLVYRAIRAAGDAPLFALTIDPEGRAWAEPVEEAAEEDLIGVFEPRSEIRDAMREALKFEAIRRGLRADPSLMRARRKQNPRKRNET